jgi:signal transduction histidine kinase
LVLIGAQLRKEGIKLKLDISQKLPTIIANQQLIQQVFVNIINNTRYALNQKYQKPHDNKILEIIGEERMIKDHSYVKVTFYDHGIGIPAYIKDTVMSPFVTTKSRGEGTGLGLSLSHKIIKDHGGKLMIDSIEGEFTKVSVILPVKMT